ncbi:cyclic nucleotide-binding domain-containing protein [Coriobacteriia bacterium Es71-Z0120]|uniref:Crp/Fnr family transcriptional regulator n=1 Tax=Parvivirga hydrogeniphila TaxID=2939460 RepID=UPI002260B7B8|nr:cyclic nucleotide-binding domain-containing protein [Parvivirga hydrogeniphila]MCL4078890.1 cyclic nucleotide-binding domain-containing protein [Parvivirga hydrogeniphila]
MQIGSSGRIVKLADGEAVFNEGDPGDRMFVVLRGAVRIKKRGMHVETVVGEMGPGEMFGESAVLEERPRSATAVAVGDTELASYDREEFLSALRSDPELALSAMRAMAERLRVTTERLQHLVTQHVLDRAEMALTEKALLEAEL